MPVILNSNIWNFKVEIPWLRNNGSLSGGTATTSAPPPPQWDMNNSPSEGNIKINLRRECQSGYILCHAWGVNGVTWLTAPLQTYPPRQSLAHPTLCASLKVCMCVSMCVCVWREEITTRSSSELFHFWCSIFGGIGHYSWQHRCCLEFLKNTVRVFHSSHWEDVEVSF